MRWLLRWVWYVLVQGIMGLSASLYMVNQLTNGQSLLRQPATSKSPGTVAGLGFGSAAAVNDKINAVVDKVKAAAVRARICRAERSGGVCRTPEGGVVHTRGWQQLTCVGVRHAGAQEPN